MLYLCLGYLLLFHPILEYPILCHLLYHLKAKATFALQQCRMQAVIRRLLNAVHLLLQVTLLFSHRPRTCATIGASRVLGAVEKHQHSLYSYGFFVSNEGGLPHAVLKSIRGGMILSLGMLILGDALGSVLNELVLWGRSRVQVRVGAHNILLFYLSSIIHQK